MAQDEYDDEYDDYEDDILDEDEDDEGMDETAAGIGAWGASVILHAAILAILGAIVALQALQQEKVPVQTPPQDLATPPPPEEKVRELKEVEVTVEAEVTDANSPIVTDLELEVTELETEDEVEAENPVKGREEAVAASETGGSGAFMAMGAGGGSAGAFGSRSGGGRKRAVGRYGGNRASESAVEAALVGSLVTKAQMVCGTSMATQSTVPLLVLNVSQVVVILVLMVTLPVQVTLCCVSSVLATTTSAPANGARPLRLASIIW